MVGKGLLKGINYLAKKTGKTVMKHPAAALGTVGLGVGIADSAIPAHRTQDNIMREYMGTPGAKYSSCSLMEKFAERKMVLAAKVSFEKVAFGDTESFNEGIGSGAGKGIVSEGIAALRRLFGSTAQTIFSEMVADPKRKKIVEELTAKDHVVSPFERNNPGQVQKTYETMRRFAPTLSTDPNLVTSFLRSTAIEDHPLDYQTIKGLAEAETAVQRAKNEGAWLRGGL